MTAPRFARWLPRLAAPAEHVHRRCIGSGLHRRARACRPKPSNEEHEVARTERRR